MNLLPGDFRFAEPLFLLLFLLIPVLVVFRWWRRGAQPTVLWADAGRWIDGGSWRTVADRLLGFLPWLAFVLLVTAMARPQSGTREMDIKSEGIDMIVVIDGSGSMRAEDFQPNNRLFVAKQVAGQFVEGRDGDRIGVVVFAGEAFTQCPLTLDQGVLQDLIQSIDFGIEPDGTAIGSNVDILSGRHQHKVGGDEPIQYQQGTYIQLQFGRNSWIGNGAVVIADIGEGAVIGAGSVVVHAIPAHSVAVGNPAVVKKRTNHRVSA